jgi:hypothetical protein
LATILAFGVIATAGSALAAETTAEFDARRKKMGITAQAVYRSVDDPNDVTVTHDFASAEKANAFAASEELKAVMQKTGVKGMPQIWYAKKAAK